MENFSQRLKFLRKQSNVTQVAMAALLSMTVRNYQDYEAGRIDPPTSKLIALADYFDVSLDYLVGRSDDPRR